jgi:uncharacterized protein YbjT (DUF2867 family)
MSTNILITGATGNIGRELATLLSNSATNVYTASTRGEGVAGLPGRKIDFLDSDSVREALNGIDTLFLLVPASDKMLEMTTNVVTVAKQSSVKHIVRLSGAGADASSPITVARVQGQCDQAIIDSGISYTFIRPKNFMQNFYNFMGDMIKSGVVYSSQGEGKIPLVDTRDIARAAAVILQNPENYRNQSVTLTGPEDLTNRQALDIIGRATGKPIQLVNIPEEAAVQAMQEMGMPEGLVEMMSSLNQVIAAGYVAGVTDGFEKITGQKPRSFAEFVHDHQAAWQ